MVKALRSCLEAAKGKIKAGHLILRKSPQENSYRIFYSLKYIPYTHSTCRIYSLLVPRILESRMSQETASVLGNSYSSGSPPSIRITEPATPIPVTGWTPFLDHGFLGPFDSGPSKAFQHRCRSE